MMMMKAAKLGWAGPGSGQEQGRNRAGAELRIVKQSRKKEGRSWVGTGEKLGMCRIGVCKEQGRSTAGVGQKQELGRSRERERGRDDDDDNDDNDDDDEVHHYQERERDMRLPVGQPLANIRL